MREIKEGLVDVHYSSEEYKENMAKITRELLRHEDFVESVFDRKFKIRGVEAKVDDYSLQGNWIDLFPANPNEGVDCLTLSFLEFAQQVEFLD